jgi:hypothetical protein
MVEPACHSSDAGSVNRRITVHTDLDVIHKFLFRKYLKPKG